MKRLERKVRQSLTQLLADCPLDYETVRREIDFKQIFSRENIKNKKKSPLLPIALSAAGIAAIVIASTALGLCGDSQKQSSSQTPPNSEPWDSKGPIQHEEINSFECLD